MPPIRLNLAPNSQYLFTHPVSFTFVYIHSFAYCPSLQNYPYTISLFHEVTCNKMSSPQHIIKNISKSNFNLITMSAVLPLVQIKSLLDNLYSLCGRLPSSILAASQEDQIYHVMSNVKGEDEWQTFKYIQYI